MRMIAVFGLGLYAVANLFAGIYDLSTEARLARHVDVMLLVTGLALLIAAILVARKSRLARAAAVTALVLASALALYNERVLHLGHPSHHLVRGPYTLLVLVAAWKCTRESV